MSWPRTSAIAAAAWVLATTTGARQAQADQEQAARLSPVPEVRAIGRQLSVVDERIVVRCRDEQRYVLVCDSDARLTVDNPRDQPIELTLETDLRASRLALDGATLPLRADVDRMVRLTDATIPPGTHELRLWIANAYYGDMSPADDLFERVLSTRHPLFAEQPGNPFTAEITIQSAKKLRRWGAVAHTGVVLRYPERWRWRGSAESETAPPPCPAVGSPPNGLVGCERPTNHGTTEVVWSFSSTDPSAFARSVALTPPAPVVFDGGPLFGAALLGSTEQWDWAEALRLWAGYEIGITDWMLVGIAAEYSAAERLTAIPTIDIAVIPQLGAIPAVSLGMGFPGRLVPEPNLGLRLQLAATWTVASAVSIGLVVPAEMFPALEGSWYPYLGAGVQLGL